MGYLSDYLTDYLRHTGPRPIGLIYAAAEQEHKASRDCVRQTLHRLASQGVLERPRHGWYGVSRLAMTTADRLMVAAVLDKLFMEYGRIMDRELERRGWGREQ